MKRTKKILSMLLIFVIVLSMEMISFETAYADTVIRNRYEDEPIIFGLDYYTGTVSCKHRAPTWSSDHSYYDYYLMSVPANGTITLKYYGFINEGDPSTEIEIIPESEDGSIKYSAYIKSKKEKYPDTSTVALKAGNYYVRVGYYSYNDAMSYTYYFSADYEFDSSTSVKLTSPSKGAIKVSAPKGDKVDGFEVRYKIDGSEEWTYIDVEGNKNLNYTVSELKKGKKYCFQARKYITDEYGDKYYSNWTKKKSITAKSK